MRQEVSRILVPRHLAVSPLRNLRTNAVYCGADDIGSQKTFNTGKQRPMPDKVEHRLSAKASAGFPHDALVNDLARIVAGVANAG